MKKITCIILTIAFVFSLTSHIYATDGEIIETQYRNLYNCDVAVAYHKYMIPITPSGDVTIYVWEAQISFPSDILENIDETYSGLYPAIKISGASGYYNCHSYAWYSQDFDTNRYWIDEPDNYYLSSTGLYSSVSSPQLGDRICYMDNRDTSNTSDDFNEHSGIVSRLLSGTSNGLCGNSDLLEVTSKWGGNGLYIHNGYECPYTDYLFDGRADYVVYYRPLGHTHSYTYSDYGSLTDHKVFCDCVGTTMYEEHSWTFGYIGASVVEYGMISPDAIPIYTCMDCGATSPTIPPNYN